MAPNKSNSKPSPDDQHPFGMPWLDSCYQETMLPNGPWHDKVNPLICEAFAKKISKQFSHPQRTQMMFELLGRGFVTKYFPDENYNPQSVTPPNITPAERKKLHLDAQNWLRNVLNLVTSDVQCQRTLVAEEKSEQQSEEMKEFLQHTRYIFLKGMDRHLYLQEKHVVDAWSKAAREDKLQHEEKQDVLQEARQKANLREEHIRLRGHALPKGILKSATSRASSVWTEVPENKTEDIAGMVYGTGNTPPVFWGMQSNTLGRAVLAILNRDPRRFHEVASRLHGHQLPGSLRGYIWLDVLLKAEREKVEDVNVEMIVRERFGRSVARGLSEMALRRPTHCPISGLIDNTVIEIYEVVPGMRIYATHDSHLKEAARALNVLFTYDKTYEPYLVHWLFPLQLTFKDAANEGDHVYDLAMYLDLLNSNCFPSWPQIFAMAETVMVRLNEADTELHDHLRHISLVEPSVNPKEFLVQLIHEERDKAEELLKVTGRGSQPTGSHLLADPLIFLRKWMGEGFVGVLDTQAAVYLWDQFFLQVWHKQAIEDACLALLLLLRHKFMEAQNYTQMRKVFIKDPSALYTKDIQQAWVHLQKGEEAKVIPVINRQQPRAVSPVSELAPRLRPPPEPRRKPRPLPRRFQSTSPSGSDENKLPAAGIKDIKLSLYLSDTAADTQWLFGFDPQNVTLKCALYFGSIQLFTKASTVDANPVSPHIDTNPYIITFPCEKFIMTDIELSNYDVESEMGGSPYAIISVEYLPPPASVSQTDISSSSSRKRMLGWSTVNLYQRRASERVEWALSGGSQSCALQAAGTFGSVVSGGVATRSSIHGLLTAPSCLECVVYDPSGELAEPHTSSVSPIIPQTTPTPSTHSSLPEGSVPGVEDAFDLYVDAVLNIPDNATIVKVTGRFIKLEELDPPEDILALPEIDSSARNPQFRFKQQLNTTGVRLDEEMLLLLRAYTVDVDTNELVVIGSCFSSVYYTDTEELQVGSHRRALHHNMPDVSDPDNLTSESFDDLPHIPACSVLFRLVKASQEYIDPPHVDQYAWDDEGFNQSEGRLAASFASDKTFPQRVKDMAVRLQVAQKDRNSDKDLSTWIRDRLNDKVDLPNEPAPNLDLGHHVLYRVNMGVNISIDQAYGLPEGALIQCYGYISPGRLARQMTPTKEGYGGPRDVVTTLTHDLNSLQKAPAWDDPLTTLHPHMDSNSVLVLRIFTIDLTYQPLEDHSGPGTVTGPGDKPLVMGELGWTVIPLFDELYVLPSEHQVPVFRGQPPDDILNAFSDTDLYDVISARKWQKKDILDAASLVVRVWDGHYTQPDELPYDIERDDSLLKASNKTSACKKAEKDTKGKKISQFLLSSLDKKSQKLGTNNNPSYEAEVDNFQTAIAEATSDLMNSHFSKG